MKYNTKIFFSVLAFLISILSGHLIFPQICLAGGTVLEINRFQVASQQAGSQLMNVVTIDEGALSDSVKGNSTATKIVIPVTGCEGIVKVSLSGQVLKILDGRISLIEIKGHAGSFVLPVSEIKAAEIAGKIEANLADMTVNIIIDGTGGEQASEIEKMIAANGYAEAAAPVEFRIEVLTGAKTVELKSFENYVERTVALSKETDVTQAVGIGLTKSGVLMPVPTQFTVIDGKTFAVIKHKSNGVYSVITHPQHFSDVAGHWGGEIINTLASKLIVAGKSTAAFKPDGKITRAEFTAIICRAMGLEPVQANAQFKDVKKGDWFSGFVGAAYNAGLISGYSDGNFRPDGQVTREQVAVILSKAFIAADRGRADIKVETAESLAGGVFNPRRDATRAEAAVMIKKMMVKAGFLTPNFELDLPADKSVTNQKFLTIAGTAEKGTSIDVNGKQTLVSDSGKLSLVVNLEAGMNLVTAKITDPWGNVSVFTRNVSYQLDYVGLVTSPTEGLVTNKNPFTVTGITKPGSTVTVNNIKTTADINGRFSKPLSLNIGKNLITVTGIDGTGSEATQQRTVIYDNVPPEITLASPIEGLETADNLLVVTGYTEPGSIVNVNKMTAQIDSKGNFSQVVDLFVYSNKITIEAVDAAGNKSSADRSVIFKSNRVEDFQLPAQIRLGTRNPLQYTLGLDGYVTLKIYDSQGTCIRTLLTDSFNSRGVHTQSWDGKNGSGELVSDGNYRFAIEEEDAEGLPLGRAELTQMAARLPSIRHLSISPASFNPAAVDSAEITFDLSGNAIVTAEVYQGQVLVKTLAANFWETAGTVSLYWDGRDNNGVFAGDGKCYLIVKAFNPADEAFASTAKGYVTLEKEAPVIKDVRLGTDKVKPGRVSLVVAYSLSEDARVTARVVTPGGGTVCTLLDGALRKAGWNSISWAGKNSAGKYVPKGTYKIVFGAADLSGKTSLEVSRTFTVETPQITKKYDLTMTEKQVWKWADTAARPVTPKVTELSLTPDVFNPQKGEAVSISYLLSADALVTVTITNGYSTVKTLVSQESQSAGKQTLTWNGLNSQGRPVGDATYTFRVEARNPASDVYLAGSGKGTVTVEQEAPTVSGLMLGQGNLKIGSNLSIRYILSENAYVDSEVTDANGILIKKVLDHTLKKAGYNSISWDGKTEDGQLVHEGSYKITINAVDGFAKTAQEQVINFQAGYQPTFENARIGNNPYNPNDRSAGEIKIEYSISHDALVTAEVTSGYSAVKKLLNAQRVSAGNNILAWDGKDSNHSIVPDGQYYIRLSAASPTVSVFQSVYKLTVTVEKEQPQITKVTVSPSPFKLTSAKQMSVRYSLSENAKVSVGVYQGDTLIKSLVSETPKRAGTGSAIWNGRDAQDRVVPRGIYNIRIKAVDGFGKIGEAGCSVEFIPEFSVYATKPDDKTADVELDSKIQVTFTEPLKKNVDFSHISVQVQGRKIQYTGVISGSTIVLTPSLKLAYGTTYTVIISTDAVADKTGRHLPEAYTFSFTTRGVARPDSDLVNLSSASTSNVTGTENQINTTIVIDEEKALAVIANCKTVRTVLIPITVDANMVRTVLTAGLIKELAAKQALIQVRSPKASLIIPASALKLDELAAGLSAEASEISINIILTIPEPAWNVNLQSWAKKQKLTPISGPVQFKLEAAAKDKTSEIINLNNYASFVLYLPKGIAASLVGGVKVNGNFNPIPMPTMSIDENGLAGAGVRSRNTGTFAVVRSLAVFRDLKAHWARQDINLLAARLIVSGVNQNSFAPNRYVTRSQFVTMVVKALGLEPKPRALVFTDVGPNAWYNEYVAAGVEAGIISGFADKTFKPEKSITREEAAVVILRAMNWISTQNSTAASGSVGASGSAAVLGRFKDKTQISMWARDYAAEAVSNGFLQGYTNGTFAPGKKISRAECAVVIKKLLSKTV